jgi:prevent-host-death family protein
MKIAAGQFKAKCLKLMDDVSKYHEEITITKYGKPIAKLVPIEEQKQAIPLFGFLQGKVTIYGDLVAPIEEKWNANE